MNEERLFVRQKDQYRQQKKVGYIDIGRWRPERNETVDARWTDNERGIERPMGCREIENPRNHCVKEPGEPWILLNVDQIFHHEWLNAGYETIAK
tara:strand:+ start:113 stop:397 length:285 start_codon:yes stop_codon:yes gene_type:complete